MSATFFGHPRGLATLFFTEMWERFTYYGMRAVLVLFLVAAVSGGGFGIDDRTATAIYGLYTAGVYLAALPGGWIADRLIGAQRAVMAGGVAITVGNTLLAVSTSPRAFYLGLFVIVIGVGLDFSQLLDRKADIGDAAVILRQSSDIEFADLRYQRRIGGKIMLDGGHHIAAGSKGVCEKRVFGKLDGVAVIENRHRQFDQAGIGLQFLVASHRDVNFDRTIVARRIVEHQRFVPDRPFADGEVADRNKRG